jgi:hypothetical protein
MQKNEVKKEQDESDCILNRFVTDGEDKIDDWVTGNSNFLFARDRRSTASV